MPQDLTNCPHERRPGTTVCLHCRHAERLAARAARAKMFSHVMVGGAILGVIAVVVSAATAAFDGRQQPDAIATATAAPATATASLLASSTPAPASAAGIDASKPTVVKEVTTSSTALGTSAVATMQPDVGQLAMAQPVIVTKPAPVMPRTPAADATAALIPMVPEGTSPLADSMTVVRQGDTMLVHFDTELGRTRRQEKFDATVRATLVQIYGSAAESLLSTVAPGTIGREGDLLAELPARGIRLRAGDGTTLSLWPITRPGRDGPLVVSYRAVVTP